MAFDIVKSLHIIFIVTWFAGLFYIYRLFIYHTEAFEKDEDSQKILSQQFKIMQSRLWYGITWPSAVLTLILGTTLTYLNPSFWHQGYFHIKIAFVAGLFAYHFWTHHIFKNLQKENAIYSSNQLRMINEVATIFLVAIVFLIELKNSIIWIYGVLGITAFAILLTISIKIYKKYREKNI